MTTGRLRAPPVASTPATDAPAEVAVRALAGVTELVDVVVPRTTVKGRMRLVRHREVAALTADARRVFAAAGFPDDPTRLAAAGLLPLWHSELALRHLAIAVRDPDDDSKPLASLVEWDECDDDQIAALWQEYQDRCEQLDPLRDGAIEISDADKVAITNALKKKDETTLRSFGSRKLSSFMLSTADPPAT